MNKLIKKHIVYLVGLHIYSKMIHVPYNIKLKLILEKYNVEIVDWI